MEAVTRYLYGDATPSPLDTDYIALLRDVVDFSVEVLLCEARLKAASLHVTQLADRTEKDIVRAEAFAAEVGRTVDRMSVGDAESIAGRCAARLRQGAAELVRAEVDTARAAVQAERAGAAQAEAGERVRWTAALETLFGRHTLPGATVSTSLRAEGAARYAAQLRCSTGSGFEWTMALAIPPSHALAQVLRIDRLVPRLEIDAPEEAGWMHKETKIRPQRFDRLHLAGLEVEPEATTLKLRASADGAGAGFDVTFRDEAPGIQLLRVREGSAAPDAPYTPAGDNVAKLRALRDSVVALASELASHKKSLARATFDGTPVAELDTPRALAERLVASIAPAIQEISKHSLARGELVLKRVLGDNHREELFVSKAEIDQKIASVPHALRQVFEPLKLGDTPAPPRTGLLAPSPPESHAPKPMQSYVPGKTPSPRSVGSLPPPPGARPAPPPLPPTPSGPPPIQPAPEATTGGTARPPRLPD